jgi:hypothetical protein
MRQKYFSKKSSKQFQNWSGKWTDDGWIIYSKKQTKVPDKYLDKRVWCRKIYNEMNLSISVQLRRKLKPLYPTITLLSNYRLEIASEMLEKK